MEYKINVPEFEGPLDLLLHLIKQSNINIQNLNIDTITKQYLAYINLMEEMNLNIASEYLVMASELIEIKSYSLLPQQKINDDEYEENTKEKLIKRLLDYEQYKNITQEFRSLEEYRKEVYTREPNNLTEYCDNNTNFDYNVTLNDLLDAYSVFIHQKDLEKPLSTKITNKEYNIGKRCNEIKTILKTRQTIYFKELFEVFTKEYFVITFLAILSMSRNQEIEIAQEGNFKNIIIKEKGEKK